MKMSDANKDQTKEQVVSTEQQQYDDNWYQVDFIVNKRLNLESGKLEYRTRWLGYTEQDDTWEPAENLSHLNCVMEFEQKLKEKKREEAQKKRTSKASRPRKTSVLGIPDAKRKKKEELQVPTADTTTVTATDTAPDTSTASLPSFAEEFSTGAKQDQVHEEVQQEKVTTATTMIREQVFGGDSVEEKLRELRLEEPTPGKHYKIQDGAAVNNIFRVAPGRSGPVSIVEYTDSTYEIVPTEVLADHCPKMLIAFYEARLLYQA